MLLHSWDGIIWYEHKLLEVKDVYYKLQNSHEIKER